MRNAIMILSLIGVVAASWALASTEQAPAPEPRQVAVTAPDPSLPAYVKALSGKWTGKWDSRFGWDAALYIEKIDKDSAQVAFAWGEYTTSKGSCHCKPNWVRVEHATITPIDNGARLEFRTPKLRPAWLRVSHTVSGSPDERYGAKSTSSGQYTYSFEISKEDPTTLKGHFWSAKESPLHIEMKRSGLDERPEAQ